MVVTPSETSKKGKRRVNLPPRNAPCENDELIYKIYNVDPLTCRCGAQMKIVAFVTEPASIRRILAHRKNNTSSQRAPPNPTLNLH